MWYSRRTQLDIAREQRRSDAKVILDRYRGPLLDAAWELGDRIDNLRHRRFLYFLEEGNPRQQDARLSTLYRFANYFGWREQVRVQVQLLRFENEEDTRLVASFLGDVTRILATDSLDGGRAMLWAEEQRGIGELMAREHEGGSTVRGHAGFWEEYEKVFGPWMDSFGNDLLSTKGVTGERLRLLGGAIFGLVICLDEEEAFPRTGWISRASAEFDGLVDLPEPEGTKTADSPEKSLGEHLMTLKTRLATHRMANKRSRR